MAERQFFARIRSGADTAAAHDGEVAAVLDLVTVERPGYLPLVTVGAGKPADVPGGKRIVRTFRRTETAIERTYSLDDVPPKEPRTFSKLKVVAALTQAGAWPQVKAWIEQAGLYDLYLAAQDFAEDNEWFAQGRAQLQSALGWTDGQVEAVLAAAEVR